jgi:putative transposase
LYYSPVGYSFEDLAIMRHIDETHTAHPWYGYRKHYRILIQQGFSIGADRVRQLMRVMAIEAIYPAKQTTIHNKNHKKYPYLLRDKSITRPNQVWSMDITYIRMLQGFCYLVAVIDWRSRFVLSWRLSNSLETRPCIEALYEALAKYPNPETSNTDQGCQFTDTDFINVLKEHGIEISMNGRGRSIDNIVIERFWWSLKYENIYLNDYADLKDLRQGISNYIQYYNFERMHQSLDYKTPADIYLTES